MPSKEDKAQLKKASQLVKLVAGAMTPMEKFKNNDFSSLGYFQEAQNYIRGIEQQGSEYWFFKNYDEKPNLQKRVNDTAGIEILREAVLLRLASLTKPLVMDEVNSHYEKLEKRISEAQSATNSVDNPIFDVAKLPKAADIAQAKGQSELDIKQASQEKTQVKPLDFGPEAGRTDAKIRQVTKDLLKEIAKDINTKGLESKKGTKDLVRDIEDVKNHLNAGIGSNVAGIRENMEYKGLNVDQTQLDLLEKAENLRDQLDAKVNKKDADKNIKFIEKAAQALNTDYHEVKQTPVSNGFFKSADKSLQQKHKQDDPLQTFTAPTEKLIDSAFSTISSKWKSLTENVSEKINHAMRGL